MFLSMFAVEAKNRNMWGNLSVMISMMMARLRVDMAKNLYFFTSSSK